jgi:hypothetical protein
MRGSLPGLLIGLVLAVAACVVPDPNAPPAGQASPPASNAACGTASARPDHYDHVVWIWMENHTYDQVLHTPAAPYETSLADACGSATDYRIAGSPSLPNYIAATAGDTFGITDDAAPSRHPLDVDNLFRQVRSAGLAEHSYQESMPSNCALTTSGQYGVKHNPAAYYSNAADRAACANDDVPFDAFPIDLDRGTLPAFSFVTPNICNDTHDCGVDVGDAWLSQWVDRIVTSATYRAGRTAVFIVWDEPTPMPFIVISPSTPHVVYGEPTGHYALLRTTEEMLGLPLLGHAAEATSLRDAFHL